MPAGAMVFDSSAMFRRYDETESGAILVNNLCDEARAPIVLSRLARLELTGALVRKFRAGTMDPLRAREYERALAEDFRARFVEVPLSESILRAAEMLLVRRFPLRAADAIHIATALALHDAQPTLDLLFVTADRRQANTAEAEGLAVQFIE